jgi:pantothenate kinase
MMPAPDMKMRETYDALAADIRQRLARRNDGEPFWLAIAGPPGAGKSTLCRALAARIGAQAIIIPMDGYHYYRSELDQMTDPQAAHQRRGAPFTFNAARFVRDLSAARRSGAGAFPSFDHGIGDPIENDIQLKAVEHRLVMVEGNYLLLSDEPWCQLQSLFDESWFLDAHPDTIRRRVAGRFLATGLAQEAAHQRVESNDIPNAELVITSRSKADRIIESI